MEKSADSAGAARANAIAASRDLIICFFRTDQMNPSYQKCISETVMEIASVNLVMFGATLCSTSQMP